MLLAGDIGGTKTRLAIFSSEGGPRAALAEASFSSSEYLSLEALVHEYLSHADLDVDRACFGVAGPVVDGQAKLTNLPWVMDEKQLQTALPLSSVRLINDLEAIACSIPILESSDLRTLNEGEPAPGGAIAVIAPGTGLGEAFLTWDGSRYQAHASEGGHADFAPTNPCQIGLLSYLLEQFEHVSSERVCSGPGIPNIYAYLRDSGYGDEPEWLAQQLAAADDPTPILVNGALGTERQSELCVATLNAFVSILGAEAGNLALRILATGGVYVGGGIPPRILPALQHEHFLESFQRKGRMSALLARVPVHVILNPKAALLGAARRGLES